MSEDEDYYESSFEKENIKLQGWTSDGQPLFSDACKHELNQEVSNLTKLLPYVTNPTLNNSSGIKRSIGQVTLKKKEERTQLVVDFDVNLLLKREYVDWCLFTELNFSGIRVPDILIATEAAVIVVKEVKINGAPFTVFRLLIDSDKVQKIPTDAYSKLYKVRKEDKKLISEVLITSSYIEIDE